MRPFFGDQVYTEKVLEKKSQGKPEHFLEGSEHFLEGPGKARNARALFWRVKALILIARPIFEIIILLCDL